MSKKILIAIVLTAAFIGAGSAYYNFFVKKISVKSNALPTKSVTSPAPAKPVAPVAPAVGLWQMVVEPGDGVIGKVIDGMCPTGGSCMPFKIFSEFDDYKPGISIGAECADGRKVGFNKETGEFEMKNIPDEAKEYQQVLGVPFESIMIPGISDGCKFYVTAFPDQAFLNKYPGYVKGITDLSATYNVYARFINQDEMTKSPELTMEKNLPGDRVEYKIWKDASGVHLERTGSVKDEYTVNPMDVMLKKVAANKSNGVADNVNNGDAQNK